jgi:hypothetical protein
MEVVRALARLKQLLALALRNFIALHTLIECKKDPFGYAGFIN